jgi:hypothetical protein
VVASQERSAAAGITAVVRPSVVCRITGLRIVLLLLSISPAGVSCSGRSSRRLWSEEQPVQASHKAHCLHHPPHG